MLPTLRGTRRGLVVAHRIEEPASKNALAQGRVYESTIGNGRDGERESEENRPIPRWCASVCAVRRRHVRARDLIRGARPLFRLGLDVIFPAFFLALLAEELRHGGRRRRAVAVALIAVGLALALVPVAPALLAALVVTETFGEDGHLVLDERAVGVAVAAIALALRAPVLAAVALAAATTALVRASI
jgi:hypothetical protein